MTHLTVFQSLFLLSGVAINLFAQPVKLSSPADDTLGQLISPVETIFLHQEADRKVCILGQRARDARLVLTPDTCFFHGRLRLAGEVAPKYPGAELNGGRSWTGIEGLDQPGKQAVWPLWLPQSATLKLAIQMDVSANAAGAALEIGIGAAKQTVITHASDASAPQPWTIELPVIKPGLYELSLAIPQAATAKSSVVIRQIVVTGPGVESAVLVRSRWRAAAIHAHFGSSQLSSAEGAPRLWVMEVRPLPCEDSMYAPVTTPFGYFGSTYEPDGTSGGVNFSMWSYGAGLKEPPVERLSHLLALGDSRQEFGRFDGEGHGVKPRGWNPFEGQKIASAVFALRLDPGNPYDTFTGYVIEPQSRHWKLYAAGRKWHAADNHERNFLPGAFVEVPGPPDVQRSAIIARGADFRGWCRDTQGNWHPLDQMTAADLKAGEPAQKTYALLPDGWFRMTMGGLEQYRYAESKPVIKSEAKPPLPDYLEPDRRAVLDQMPASVVIQEVQISFPAATLKLQISAPLPGGKVTVFYGPTDALTFAERWAHHLEIGEKPPGVQTVRLPDFADARACRVLLRGNFGSVWSDSPAVWH